MAKVLTDKTLIEKFLTRGVEEIYPTVEELRKKLLSGDRLRIYQGFDPTGPYLHVGHAMGIRALRILQQLGHEVVFLVGDFTATVGDPDKDTTRDLLTGEQIEKNMAGWKEQAAQMIDFAGDNPVQFRRNSEWLSQLSTPDMIKLLSQITLQRMLERDLFDRRMKANDPIRLHELTYPLLQGYDGAAMEVDMEIGGSDQTFNMLVGRHISKVYAHKEKYVRTNKMMDAPDGRTMSKTKGNGINLNDSPEDMYGKAMSYPDSAILAGLELLTDVPKEQVGKIEQEIAGGANPMEFKKMMAYEIVKLIKGEEAAQKGRAHFEKVVQKKDIPEDIEEVRLPKKEWTVLDLVTELKLVPSKSEIRRLILSGGIKIDGKKVADVNEKVSISQPMILQVGKRKLVRIQ